jgi:hypothetical protein
MPPRDDGADLVRLIRGVRGRVELRTEFILRFDYGFSVPWIERLARGALRARRFATTTSASLIIQTSIRLRS